jgi:hypothetical protein
MNTQPEYVTERDLRLDQGALPQSQNSVGKSTNQDTTNVANEDLGFASHKSFVPWGDSASIEVSAGRFRRLQLGKNFYSKLEKEQEAVVSTSNLNGFQY